MSTRILFVEDEPAFAVGIVDRLEFEGYQVECVADGLKGFERAQKGGFDLIILDLMLPNKSGMHMCRELRSARVSTPILMLTARGEVIDRVRGLKLGADDYIVKSCDIMELLARVEALIRRSSGSMSKAADLIEIGDVQVDLKANEITRWGRPVLLPPVEFRLLKYLLEHRGSVVTREELLANVWSLAGETLTRTVDVHMAGLRRKIERDSRYPEVIITVKGFGYRMI
jgi:two-component system alkaline phosphatase synthesis response regulator PhoP